MSGWGRASVPGSLGVREMGESDRDCDRERDRERERDCPASPLGWSMGGWEGGASALAPTELLYDVDCGGVSSSSSSSPPAP